MTTETTTITMHHASVSWDADRDDLRAQTVRPAEQTMAVNCPVEVEMRAGGGREAEQPAD